MYQTTTHLAKIMEQIENLSVKIEDILMIKEHMENLKLKVKSRYKVLAHDKSILSWKYQNYKKRLIFAEKKSYYCPRLPHLRC